VHKQGIVLRSTGSWYTVRDEDGKNHYCRLRGQFRLKGLRSTNPIAVGDKVTITIDESSQNAVIKEVHERTNFIIRKATRLSKLSHIIAANLDQAILVATIDQPRTSTGFIDRFLATAEAYQIPAAIVFNKIDLYSPQQADFLSKLVSVYSGVGYPCFLVSALHKQNLGTFAAQMKDKISLLTGHSGVGKTALLNAIAPDLNLKTGQISSYHNKGKHTTTFAEMHALCSGGWLVDTPGIKEFGLYDFKRETLAQRFPEMRALMQLCRFANCIHLHEPGCAVKQAVEKKEIAQFRYKNYVNMMFSDFTNEKQV
jgi:ribosome biogenesis GTPase / thiamine phosphate phosphatase